MRVIAGQWKGTKLKSEGRFKDLRPLTDRIKESLFGILGDKVFDSTVFDLYAGTGAFGIEALSRGAQFVLFNEKSPAIADCIKKNLDKVKCEREKYEILVADALKAVAVSSKRNLLFDIIFSDPPFCLPIGKQFLYSLSEKDLLDGKGILIFRHHKNENLPQEAGNFRVIRKELYGDSVVEFYKKVIPNENSSIPRNI